jgi:hypothetical protein
VYTQKTQNPTSVKKFRPAQIFYLTGQFLSFIAQNDGQVMEKLSVEHFFEIRFYRGDRAIFVEYK